MVQRVTTNDNEWYKEWQQMTKSDNEWQRMTMSGTKNDNEWPFRLISLLFFQMREDPTTKQPTENSLNLEEDLWRMPVEFRAETSTQEKISTVRSTNCRSSCSQIFIEKSVLKNFVIFTGKRLCWSPFLRKLRPSSLLKGDSNTNIFLWILQNF